MQLYGKSPVSTKGKIAPLTNQEVRPLSSTSTERRRTVERQFKGEHKRHAESQKKAEKGKTLVGFKPQE